jgi:hypothetical protein
MILAITSILQRLIDTYNSSINLYKLYCKSRFMQTQYPYFSRGNASVFIELPLLTLSLKQNRAVALFATAH